MKDRICTYCYHVGQPTTQGVGSFAVDGLIWMMFFSLAMMSSLFPLMIIPVAWTAYHIAIYRKSTCPKCGRINMVSLTSRKGKRALRGPTVKVTYFSEDGSEHDTQPAPQQHRRANDRRASDRQTDTPSS